MISAIIDIVKMELEPNLTFNIEETKRRIDETVKTVKPVMGILKKGQMIAREGDTITTESLYKINVLNQNTASYNITYIIGILLFQLIIMFISFFFSIEKENKILQSVMGEFVKKSKTHMVSVDPSTRKYILIPVTTNGEMFLNIEDDMYIDASMVKTFKFNGTKYKRITIQHDDMFLTSKIEICFGNIVFGETFILTKENCDKMINHVKQRGIYRQ